MSKFKFFLLLTYLITVNSCSEVLSHKSVLNHKSLNVYTVDYKDINLYPDLIQNSPYEARDYYRLAMINMRKYFDAEHKLQKIVVTFQGQNEKGISKYVFKRGILYFVRKAKVFDNKKSFTDYFFKGKKLVKCIDDKEVKVTDCKHNEKIILHDAGIYKGLKE